MTSKIHDAAHLGGRELRGSCHACGFCVGAEEEYRTLLPFAREGVDAGDRCFQFVDPARQQERLEHLGQAGIDLDQAVASGQLEVRTWTEGPLRGGHFDQQAMLALIEETLHGHRGAGYRRTRLWADMGWTTQNLPGLGDFVEFESRLNPVIERGDDLVVCMYDLNKGTAPFVMDLLRTHPMVLIGGMLQDSPFYVSTDRFLDDLARRRKTLARVHTASE